MNPVVGKDVLDSSGLSDNVISGSANPWRKFGRSALCALAFMLPFELKNPLFVIGPVGITSVELTLYLVLGIWLAFRLAGGGHCWSFVHTAVVVWAVVTFASAFAAPSYRYECVKFALRSLQGCLLCFAAADFVQTPRTAAMIGLSAVAGSGISALAGLAEVHLPAAAAVLAVFKTGPSLSGSYLRASGTFQYANIASMYWEATLPLALAVPVSLTPVRSSKRWQWAGFLSSLLLMEAILVAASRAGILVVGLTLTVMWFLAGNARRPLRSAVSTAGVAFLLLLAVHIATDGLLRLRLTSFDASTWYRADYRDFPDHLTLEAGTVKRVPIAVHNLGRIAWNARGSQSVAVSYHWLDPTGTNILIWDGARTALTGNVNPGSSQNELVWIKAPSKAGRYILQWDMVQEDVAWFSVFSPGRVQIPVLVLPSKTIGTVSDLPSLTDLPLPRGPQRGDLWRAAAHLWMQRPILGVGPDNFRRLYGPPLGLKTFDQRIYANNLYLEILADTGLMGMLALLLILATAVQSFYVAWSSMKLPQERMVLAGAGLGLCAFYWHGLLDYFLAFTPTYGLFWLLTGVITGLKAGQAHR